MPPLFRLGTASFLPPPTAGHVLSVDVLLTGAELVESVCALIRQAKHGPVPQAAVTARFVGSVALDSSAVVASCASATELGKARSVPDQSSLRERGSSTANATQALLNSSSVSTPLLPAHRVMAQLPDLSSLPASQRRVLESFDPWGFAASVSLQGHDSVSVPTASAVTVASFSSSALFGSLNHDVEMSPEVQKPIHVM